MAYSTRARLQPSKTAIATVSDKTIVTTSTQKMKESPIKKNTSKIPKTTESDNISKQSISPKRTTVKKTKNDPHALSSYFSKRGTVQYSYQISPTPRVFNPVDTSPLEPSSDKKVSKGRKKRKSDQAEIFDYISDDEEVLIPSIKKIKASSVKQKAKKMSPVKPVAGTKRSISTAKKLEKSTAEVKEKPKQAPGKKSLKGSNVRVGVSPTKKSVSKKPKSPKKVVKVVSQQPSTGKRVRGTGKPNAKTKRQEKEQPEKSKSEAETGGRLRRANVRRRVLTKQRNASEEEDNETISKDEKEINEEQKQLDDVVQKTERESENEIHVEEMEVEKIDDTTGEEEIPSEEHAPIDSLKNNSVKHDCEMEQDDEKNSDGESCNDKSLRQHVDSDDVENDLKKESTCNTCLVSTLDTGSEGRDELTVSGTGNDDDTLLDDRKEMECQATISSGRETHLSRQSLDCAPDLSLTETESDFKRKSFDRHLKGTQTNIPSLARSSTWPKATPSSSHQIFSHPSQDKSLTVVRNVRQAHECLQHGENLQFRDEVEYLLDNMRPEQPLSLRCLSTLNLACECLKPDFSRQLRAHGLVNKILVLLKDALEHPSLQVVTATFFFVICQHRMDSSDLDRKCVELLNGLLEKSSDDIHDYSEQQKEDKGSLLEGKAAREYEKIKQKAKSVLEKCSPLPLKDKERGSGRTEDDKEEDEEVIEVQNFDQDGLKPACLTISELVSECFHNLTSNQSNCHWIKEEMRILGTLDHVANIAIALSNSITWDESEEIDKKELLLKLLRSLKLLENVTFLNKGNQTYLTVFDGSLLISKLCKLIAFSQNLLIHNSAGNIYKFLSLECLLGVLRVLLNFTHDHELGSFRVGEQQDILESILDCVFKIPQCISGDRKFDMLILSLGLLINLVEHSAPNRQLLYTTEVNTSTVHGLGEVMDSKSAVNAVLELFLSHYKRAEDATIEVPTPQRLSQLTPTSSPLKGSPQVMKRDFSATLASRLKSHKDIKGYRSPAKLHIDEGTTSQENEDNKDFEELEEEEEIEDEISADPLVFSREEFDTALTQAGRHMEDSIISSYSALLLAVLAKHSSEFAEILKEELPNRNYTSIISVLRDFIQFMNMAGSSTTRSGLESIRKIVKHLETLQD